MKTPEKINRILQSVGVQMSGADTATPFDLALRLVDQIPKEKFNTKALVPGSGYACPFPLALVHRGWDPANIACIENSPAYVALTSAAMREFGIEVLYQDLLTWLTHMRFDVIIGNPPYQRPKHAEGNKDNRPLWISFLKLSGELLRLFCCALCWLERCDFIDHCFPPSLEGPTLVA